MIFIMKFLLDKLLDT